MSGKTFHDDISTSASEDGNNSMLVGKEQHFQIKSLIRIQFWLNFAVSIASFLLPGITNTHFSYCHQNFINGIENYRLPSVLLAATFLTSEYVSTDEDLKDYVTFRKTNSHIHRAIRTAALVGFCLYMQALSMGLVEFCTSKRPCVFASPFFGLIHLSTIAAGMLVIFSTLYYCDNTSALNQHLRITDHIASKVTGLSLSSCKQPWKYIKRKYREAKAFVMRTANSSGETVVVTEQLSSDEEEL